MISNMERYDYLFDKVTAWFRRQPGPQLVLFMLHRAECYAVNECVCGALEHRVALSKAIIAYHEDATVLVRRS